MTTASSVTSAKPPVSEFYCSECDTPVQAEDVICAVCGADLTTDDEDETAVRSYTALQLLRVTVITFSGLLLLANIVALLTQFTSTSIVAALTGGLLLIGSFALNQAIAILIANAENIERSVRLQERTNQLLIKLLLK